MKEILVRRNHENFSMADYKVVVENGPTILIRNGETKKLLLDIVPVTIYAKRGWLKSKEVTVDNSTTEINLKNERTKTLLAPWMGGFLVFTTLLPKAIWGDSGITQTITIVGLSISLLWTIYAFIIKTDSWILIDKKTIE